MLEKPIFKNVFDFNQNPLMVYPLYNTEEINVLIRYFADFNDIPLAVMVYDLLHQTEIFRNSTSPDFLEMRMQNKTEQDLKNIFERMSSALSKASQEQAKYEQKSLDFQILNSAIAYCQMCIRKRMASLKVGDPLIELYEKSRLISLVN